MRQGLGYKYQHQARRLADFVSFMEKRRATTITAKLAVTWATLPPDRHASWALRLTDVRGFARHVANIDPKTEVPPAGILPRLKRAKPYVYSDAEPLVQIATPSKSEDMAPLGNCPAATQTAYRTWQLQGEGDITVRWEAYID